MLFWWFNNWLLLITWIIVILWSRRVWTVLKLKVCFVALYHAVMRLWVSREYRLQLINHRQRKCLESSTQANHARSRQIEPSWPWPWLEKVMTPLSRDCPPVYEAREIGSHANLITGPIRVKFVCQVSRVVWR
jgi:hypothetical protein